MPAKPKPGNRPRRRTAAAPVVIERVADLEPFIDQIIEALNADQRRALLAVAEPVQILADLGFRLQPEAARELRRILPRLSREARAAYVAWINGQDELPPLPTLRLARRSVGAAPRRAHGAPLTTLLSLPASGAHTAGFDILAYFGEGLCERLVRHHYTEGRLPQSVYRVGGKLRFFRDEQGYADEAVATGATADRELHIGVPTLQLNAAKPDRARVVSPFVAHGFSPVPLKGSIGIDGHLALHKDSTGHPAYLEIAFENIQASDVIVTAPGTMPAELKQAVLEAYKTFRASTANPFVGEQRLPVTLTLVDGNGLAGQNIAVQPGEVQFKVVCPAGASSAAIAIGFNRAELMGNGNLAQAGFAAATGDDLAVFQSVGWLEPGLNAACAKGLPVRLNQDSGERDANGDLVLAALIWKYRKGGITGHLTGTLEDALWGINATLDREIRVNLTYSAGSPSGGVLYQTDQTGEYALECFGKLIFALVCALIGAILGGVVGGVVGGIVGGVVGGTVGASVGITAGFLFGLFGMPYLLGWFPVTFDTSGLPAPPPAGATQKLNLANDTRVPESIDSVAVRAGDFEVDSWGTRFVASVDGPATELLEPGVTVTGYLTAVPTANGAGSVSPPHAATAAVASEMVPSLSITATGAAQAPAGWVTLHYQVQRTWGLQGKPSFSWTFNGKPIGSTPSVEFVFPLKASDVRANEAVQVGILQVTATDVFGRKATWSGTLTIGNEKDLRAFVPLQYREPGFVDPRERLGARVRPPETVTHLAWTDRAGGPALAQGALVAQAVFSRQGAAEAFAIVCTAP